MAKKTRTKKVSDNNKAKVAKEKVKVTAKKLKSNIVTLSSSIISDESFIESYSDMCGYTDLSDRSSFIEIDIHKTGRHILDKGVVKSDDAVGKYMTSVLYDLPVDYDNYPSVFNILKQMVMDHMFDHSYLHSNTKSLNTPVGFEVMSSDNPEFKEPHTYQMIKDNDDIISAISRNNRFMHDFSLISRYPVNFINRLLNTDIDFINRREQMQKLLSISADNIITYICDIRNEFDRLDTKEKECIKKFYKGEIKIDQLYAMIKPVVVKYDNSNILDIIVQAACWYLVTNVFSGDCMVMSYILLLVTWDQITQNQHEAIMNYLKESYCAVAGSSGNVKWYNEFSSKTLYEILNENARFKSDIYDAEYRFTSGEMSGYDIQRFVGTQTFFEAGDVAMNIVYDLNKKDYDACELVDNDGFKLPKCTSILDFISGETNINGFYHDIMNFSFTNGVCYVHRMLDDIKKYLICNLFEGDDLMHLHMICDCINEYRIKEMNDNLYKDKDNSNSVKTYIVPIKVFCKEDVQKVNPLIVEREVDAKCYNEARELALIDLRSYFKNDTQIDIGIARLAVTD